MRELKLINEIKEKIESAITNIEEQTSEIENQDLESVDEANSTISRIQNEVNNIDELSEVDRISTDSLETALETLNEILMLLKPTEILYDVGLPEKNESLKEVWEQGPAMINRLMISTIGSVVATFNHTISNGVVNNHSPKDWINIWNIYNDMEHGIELVTAKLLREFDTHKKIRSHSVLTVITLKENDDV